MKPLYMLAIAAAIFMTPSCKEGVDNEGKTRIIQDSLSTVLPTWQALKIKVEDNNTEMNIVVGDATLYKAPQDVKEKKADDVARLVLRIYGPGNYLEKGSLILTNDIHNTSEQPADGIKIPIDFARLKQGNK